MVKEAEADERTGKVQESEHRSRVAVEAEGQATLRQHPRIGPLHGPAVSAQARAGLDATPGESGRDAAPPQCWRQKSKS
jgi:hypothetical protein